MLGFYSATPAFGMRVFNPPLEDARDGFDGILYTVKAMLATDHNVNRIV